MFKVGLDVSGLDQGFREHAARGIGRYVSELKRFFDGRSDPELQVEYFDHATLTGSPRLSRWIDRVPLGRRTLKQQVLFPLRMSSRRLVPCDVIHFPAHMDAPAWCLRRCVLTVLDLIPLVLEDLYRAERGGLRFKLARWLECQAIRNAALILAISENTALDLHRVLGIPPEKIVVTPLGVDEKFFSARLEDEETAFRERLRIPLGRDLLLYVGGIDPRKNWRGLLDVLAGILERRRVEKSARPVLIMSGKIEQDRQYPQLVTAIRERGLEQDVVLTGYVEERDLLQLYALSKVFCFLSLYEGFGLPPLEAMAAGLPVVCSRSSSLPEVVGESGILVNPEDCNSIIQQVCRLLDQAELRFKPQAKGRARARRFSWQRTGELTLAAYRHLAG